ncbi:hypothetical protein K437DRAFT_295010 [Tilletiaria anomala UBC 951]|uniref:histidine kinase n=1 Tax=Tilletiaria anomala (strain ATCC 24038 / CBS 436.72 / UBC 951) TaxID=1037660 RepID=A0A066VR37_TILAU|nr:uncharacterized protein K437DRAFT_295010 [Tilletiaria anomala UBC 951]KDN43901.1 hypothetical protein K437DRAFT_295010 [Tilletiaria anomala UBC 951]
MHSVSHSRAASGALDAAKSPSTSSSEPAQGASPESSDIPGTAARSSRSSVPLSASGSSSTASASAPEPAPESLAQRRTSISHAANRLSQGAAGTDSANTSFGSGGERTATADVAELMQSVQHELRTPVHGLLSMLEYLRKDIAQSAAFNLPDAHPLLAARAPSQPPLQGRTRLFASARAHAHTHGNAHANMHVLAKVASVQAKRAAQHVLDAVSSTGQSLAQVPSQLRLPSHVMSAAAKSRCFGSPESASAAAGTNPPAVPGENGEEARGADAAAAHEHEGAGGAKATIGRSKSSPGALPMAAVMTKANSANHSTSPPFLPIVSSSTPTSEHTVTTSSASSSSPSLATTPASLTQPEPPYTSSAPTTPSGGAAVGSESDGATPPPLSFPKGHLSAATASDLAAVLREERRSLLSRLDGALGLVERLHNILDDYNDFASEILLADRDAAHGFGSWAAIAPTTPVIDTAVEPRAAALGAPTSLANAFRGLALHDASSLPVSNLAYVHPAISAPISTSTLASTPRVAQSDASEANVHTPMLHSRSQSRSRILASASSSEREIDGIPLTSPPAPSSNSAGLGDSAHGPAAHPGRDLESKDAILDEPVNFGTLLDEVACEAWNQQVRALRAEDADARLPPPPELILQIDTSLRHVKSVVSVTTVKKLMHKLISNSLRFTKEGYVEVSVMPGIAGEDTLDAAQAETDRYAEAALASEALRSPTPPAIRNDLISIVVEDTGEGMTSTFMQENLFMPFQKANRFKAGAGLSMTLCASLVRKLRGRMHIASDAGRGTIVTVTIPVVHHYNTDISPGQELPPSNVDRLVYLYGFEGMGMQRLAQAITAQLATFGNFYCTTSIKDCDYILLPEEKCIQTDAGVEAVLAQCRPGVKIGVLQAHEDVGIERAASLNRSEPPVFVTRKPFGPKAFEALLGAYSLSQLSKAIDGEVSGALAGVKANNGKCESSCSEGDYFSAQSLSEKQHLKENKDEIQGYSASVGRMDGQALVGSETSGDGEDEEGKQKTVEERTANERLFKAAKKSSRGILPDLLFAPSTMDAILRAPQARAPLLPLRRKFGSTGQQDSESGRSPLSSAFPIFAGSMKSIMEGLAHMHQKIISPNLQASPDTAADASTEENQGSNARPSKPGEALRRTATKTVAAAVPPAAACDTVRKQAEEEASAFSVLCVEDNPLNMRVMTQMLKQSRILQFSATDGVEAVELFKEVRPSVVLLDINMPRMDGFEACEEMRRFEREEVEQDKLLAFSPTRRVASRIVAVTALSDDFHQQKGLSVGMDDWLTKPIKMNTIKKDLAVWKEEWEQALEKSKALEGQGSAASVAEVYGSTLTARQGDAPVATQP